MTLVLVLVSRLYSFPTFVSLEEYLHELCCGEHGGDASMQSVDQGVPVPVKANFAQAALLLHNSSHVYSRKVEYLYSLVNQQLDSLLAVNSQKKQNSRGRTVDPELEEFREFDPHQQFLLLDDVLPTDKTEDCRHINLPQSRTDQEIFAAESGNESMRGQSLTHATSISATSRTFHTLGVSKILSQINTQSSAELRLMDGHCDLDSSGRLLVPGCQSTTTPASESVPSVESPAGQQEPEYAQHGDFDGDEYDDDGPGFMMGDDDDDNVEGDEETQNNNAEVQARQGARKSVTINLDKNQVVQLEPERPDPWALLDPHSTDTRKSRPFKLGKTLRVPPGLDDLPSDCVSGSHTRKWKPVALPPPVKAVERKFFATETFNSLSRKRRLEDDEENQSEQDVAGEEFSIIPLKGLVYGEEFAYLAREHAQRKAAARRQLRREQEQQRMNQPAQASTRGATDHNDNYDDDDDDFGGGYAFGDDDDNDYDAGPVAVEGVSPLVETNTGLQTVDDVYRGTHENGKAHREL